MIVVVIQSSAILFIALCSALILRRQSAATRHAILMVGLVSSLAVPFLGGVVGTLCGNCRAVGLPVLATPDSRWPSETLGPDREPPAASAAPLTTVRATPVRMPKGTFRWIWLGGIGITGTTLVAGVARIASLVARSKTVDSGQWVSASKQISHLLRLKRTVRLVKNDRAVLGTLGVLRPKVFIPFDTSGWSDDRIRLVLTHELAHIKRLDWPVQLLAELASAVYWFNPLFWFVCRRLRSESEHACDDVVLNAGFDAKDYAAHLLDLARTLKNSDLGWSSVLAISQPPNLERRFVAMLNPSLNHRPASRRALFAVGVAALCVTVPLAAMRATTPEQLRPAVEGATVVPAIVPLPKAVVPASAVKMSKPPLPKPAAVQGLADGSLSGTVYDATGAVVPDVRMTLTKVDLTAVVETNTGSAGEYEFGALPPGVYLLTAQRPGFMNAARRIDIRSSQTSQANITLSVGGVAERLNVSAVGQSKPTPFPGTPQRVRVGGNIQPPRLVRQVKPVYPVNARNEGIEGTVHLQGIIASDGTLVGLHALNGADADLMNAALEAAKQWQYLPAALNGVPIEVVTQIDIEFKLVQ